MSTFQLFDVHVAMEEAHWWFLARRDILRALVTDLLPPSKDTLIADIGCGTGGNAADLAKQYAVIGIDSEEEGIAFAKQRFPEVTFAAGRFQDVLDRSPAKPKLFLLMDVLEHIEDDQGFFNDVVKHMTPGSLLIITVPADMMLWSQHDVSAGHYRRYDRQRLRALWKSAPVRERLCSAFNTRLYPLVLIIRTLNRLRGTVSGKKGTDFALPWHPLNTLLRRIFAGEARVLRDLLAGRRRRGYSRGVSLIAILERI